MIMESVYHRVDIPLTTPVVIQGRALRCISIRMPTCRDLVELGAPLDKIGNEWRATPAIYYFVKALSGESDDVILAMSNQDYIACGETLLSMFAWMTGYVRLFLHDQGSLNAANER